MRHIHLAKYDWDICLYDDVSPNNVRRLIPELLSMGMEYEDTKEIVSLFDAPSRGFIYTDREGRCSLIAIGWCMSWKQELNTLAHEIYHLAEHVCRGCNLSTDGEPPAYVVSELIEQVCNG